LALEDGALFQQALVSVENGNIVILADRELNNGRFEVAIASVQYSQTRLCRKWKSSL